MLNEQEIDQVVGGVFQFYKKGTKCLVGGKSYNCSSLGQFQVINLINDNPNASESELLEMAIDQKILWE